MTQIHFTGCCNNVMSTVSKPGGSNSSWQTINFAFVHNGDVLSQTCTRCRTNIVEFCSDLS